MLLHCGPLLRRARHLWGGPVSPDSRSRPLSPAPAVRSTRFAKRHGDRLGSALVNAVVGRRSVRSSVGSLAAGG